MEEQVTTTEPVTVENQMEKRKAFGDAIRLARLNAGMSEEAVAQSTRIAKHFVTAIEAGDFSKLPGVLFGRGFVQNISRAISADEASLVAAYLECSRDLNAPSKTSIEVGSKKLEARKADSRKIEPRLTAKPVRSAPMPKPTTSSDSNSGGSRVKSFSKVAIALPVAAAAIGLVALFVIGRKNEKAADTSKVVEAIVSDSISDRITDEDLHEDPPAEAAAAAGVAPVEQEVIVAPVVEQIVADATPPVSQKVEVPVAPVKPAAPATAPVAASIPASVPAPAAPVATPAVEKAVAAASNGATSTDMQVLELTVKVPVKIRITVDGGSNETQDLKVETYRFQFKDRADLMIYDASSVDVAFNGRSLGSLGSKGRIRRLSFAAPQSAQSAAPSSRVPSL